jgi:Ca-activated chloride channel homolog
MLNRRLPGIFLLVCFIFPLYASADENPAPIPESETLTPNTFFSSSLTTMNLWSMVNAAENRSPLLSLAGSVSKLDLKASGQARREYEEGYQCQMQKNFMCMAEHMELAVAAYPEFVAAHNALGAAYLYLGHYDRARAEFTRTISLDDHLPLSYLNLGCVQLALKDYRSAEASMQKSSSLAPLDLQVVSALAYALYMNQNYEAVLATVRQVHNRKHPGAAIVHYYAAAAWAAQNNPRQTLKELQTFLQENPKSALAEPARQVMALIKFGHIPEEVEKQEPSTPAPASASATRPAEVPKASYMPSQLQMALQDSKEQKQISEAEADPLCAKCNSAQAGTNGLRGPSPNAESSSPDDPPFALHSVVNEVALLFAATDHGKSVTDLTREGVELLDDKKSPSVITGFRNETQLPLRLGIVIDTSNSITSRFSFEQNAATDFLQEVVADKNDLAFVVGVAYSVLLVQDFTNDQQRISHGVDQLAPAGGTALWDAVAFAADKLSRPETQPVARMLVVISDGKDNSSSTTLKEAIEAAERGEVFVYTVSTREATDAPNTEDDGERTLVGDRALKLLADRTGGAAFVPGSLKGLSRSLDELQQVIRSRYLISYKPAQFKSDGHYRSIEITAKTSGHKLRVYSRKGYYARGSSSH